MVHERNSRSFEDKASETRTYDDLTSDIQGPPSAPLEANSSRQEEIASELSTHAFQGERETHRDSEEEQTKASSAVGWLALTLAVLSYFMMPIILGTGGIILGFVARTRHTDTLGNTAIITGAASIIITLFILPFV
ncbi:hypothetical protein [Lentibacillus saliphilus]|uniref:hypothetical protein n=1 Tax=Lentibacillus saliphilus TaxID=2737028 RepID=UPI001C2FEB5A|nr:hypothetical protein [Lentibacillus saliphilus]